MASNTMIRDTSQSDIIVTRESRFGRKKLLLAAVAGAALLLGVSAYSAVSPWLSAERTVSADRLRIMPVVRGNFERSISVQGTVDAAIRPTVYSLSEGVVTLHVKAGDTVEKDQLIAEIDNPEARSALKQEEARLQQVGTDLARLRITSDQQKLANAQELALQRIELDAAERRVRRTGEALAKNVISRQDHEEAEDTLATAQTRLKHNSERVRLESDRLNFEVKSKALEVERQELALAEVRRRVDELRILSPTAGVVGNVAVQERDKVALNQALMTVVDLSAYEVLVTIPESYSDDLAPPLKASINVQGRVFTGSLTSISPEVRDGHVEGRIALDDSSGAGLKQKQRLTAKIVLDSRPDALTVPRGPFLEDGAGRVAYVVDGKLATLRPIKTGAVGVSDVEILDGLREGEQVVISSTSAFEQAKTVLIR
jgi:HlyD family secretion protein